MKQTINGFQFIDAFRAYDRMDNFSRRGLLSLFGYFEELEEDIGEEIELDVIAICCDYAEYSLDDLQREYGDHMDQEWDTLEEAVEWLQDHTTVIPVDEDSVIVQSF